MAKKAPRTVVIGVDMFWLAKMITEDDTNTIPTYDTPRHFPGVRNVKLTARASASSWYDDNTLFKTFNRTDGIDMSIEKSMLSIDEFAYMFGSKVNDDGEIEDNILPSAPYFGGMYRRKLDGTLEDGRQRYRYVTFYKYRPGRPDETTQGEEQTTTPQPETVTGTILPLQCMPGEIRKMGENDTFTAEFESAYFGAIRLPGIGTITPGVIAVDKLPETGQKNAKYVLLADDGARERGTMWEWTGSTYKQLYTFEPVQALPEAAEAAKNTVYILLEADGERAAGSSWIVSGGEWLEYSE